jgi:diguanylate cyclase (GGDEF)-like protein
VISIKRYLNSEAHSPAVDLVTAMRDAYRSALTAMATSAARACPPVGQDLHRRLTTLGMQLSDTAEPELVATTAAGVDGELQQWGDGAQAYLNQKTDDVKELLEVLARTAATIGASDQRYAKRFDEFSASLRSIATLEDLTQVRKSLVKSATELRSCVEQMSRDSRQSVAQLQAEVVTYQTKLEEVEQLASRDALTGLFNRGGVMAHIEQCIAAGQTFSVVVLDLDGFKQVNDRFGHAVGDDLLKQFSAELRSNARAGDVVGRWGGDEFIVVLGCSLADAQTHVDRIEKWVVGEYVLASATGPQKAHVGASIGLDEWQPGKTMREVIDRADAAMYQRKARARG